MALPAGLVDAPQVLEYPVPGVDYTTSLRTLLQHAEQYVLYRYRHGLTVPDYGDSKLSRWGVAAHQETWI